MEDQTPEYLLLGKIVRPRGLAGEVKVQIFYHDPENLPRFVHVFLEESMSGNRTAWRPAKIRASAVRGAFWYVRFDGIDSVGGAQRLRGSHVAVRAGDLKPLPDQAFYHHELRGLRVVDRSGKALGKVVSVVNHASLDFVVVEGESLFTVPLTRSVVERVDREAGQMVLKVDLS